MTRIIDLDRCACGRPGQGRRRLDAGSPVRLAIYYRLCEHCAEFLPGEHFIRILVAAGVEDEMLGPEKGRLAREGLARGEEIELLE